MRPIWRAFRFCLDRGDSMHFQPARKAFDRALKRYMAAYELNREAPLGSDFPEYFRHLCEKPLLRRIHPYVFDMFGLRYRDFLYARIANLVMERGEPAPQLETLYQDPGCIREIADHAGACVVLALHTGFPHNVRLLSDAGRSGLTSILGVPEFAESFFRSNHVRDFDKIRVVPVGRDTLVHLNVSARDGHAICCNPDYVDPATGKCDLISPALFEFAARKNIPIFFFDYAVTEQGQLQVFSERAERSADVDDAMEQFALFCLRSSGRHVSATRKTRSSGLAGRS